MYGSTTSTPYQFVSVEVYFCPEMTIDRNFVEFSIVGDLYSKTVFRVHKIRVPSVRLSLPLGILVLFMDLFPSVMQTYFNLMS